MEKIEALVNVLARFGDELGTLKDLIAEMQAGVSKHTTDLKKEMTRFKQNSKSTYFSSAVEKEIQERIRKLKVEIEKLELLKRRKEESLKNGEARKCVTKAVNVSAENKTWKPTWNNTEDFAQDFNYESSSSLSSPTPSVVIPPYRIKREEGIAHSVNNGSAGAESPPSGDWWKEQNESLKNSKKPQEPIDWERENAEREECKHNLMVQEGWKKANATYEDLETVFLTWTGKFIKWTTVKKGRSKGGKTLINVKFESLEDREKVYKMRKAIAEDGYLFVGEALSYVEKKERWIMLLKSESLKREGRNVEFENRRICVDNEWWKYDWVEGWKRL